MLRCRPTLVSTLQFINLRQQYTWQAPVLQRSKRETSGERLDIRLKSNWFYECGLEHCFVTLKAKCYKSKATCTNERQTGHARQNCKKEYMNKTLVLNNSSDIAAWVPHECSQQLMLSFKSTRESNCWSTSENRRGTRGAERDGAPRTTVLGNHINHLK